MEVDETYVLGAMNTLNVIATTSHGIFGSIHKARTAGSWDDKMTVEYLASYGWTQSAIANLVEL